MSSYKYDLFRYYGRYKINVFDYLFMPNGLRYLKVYRKASESRFFFVKYFHMLRLKRMFRRMFIQIPCKCKIGKGFYIGHNGRIIINPEAIIGDNCNIATGVTIGQENRGSRKGTPTIGNEVWIGTNAVIVGNIKIGNDVLIAPNSYVNFDVPSHSIVIGNPGKIIHRDNATDGYINNKV